jgi:molybdenum cofactor synthesis domain-containing protein
MSEPPSAAVLIIGNEILSGKFRDENSPWLASRLREQGIDLVRIETVPDDVEVIADATRRLRRVADWLITSGGVGPTHDDVTVEGLARGLDVEVVVNNELLSVLKDKLGPRYTPAAARMALVPAGAELWWEGPIAFPQVVVDRVIIFPGVPGLLRRKFDAIVHRLGGHPVLHRRMTTTLTESAIADALRALQARHPAVEVGSYPRYESRPWTVIVTMDSRNPVAIEACAGDLQQLLGDSLLPDEE